jgi:hypothetical protein
MDCDTSLATLGRPGLRFNRLRIVRDAAPATTKARFLQNAGYRAEAVRLELSADTCNAFAEPHLRDAFEARAPRGVGAERISASGSVLALGDRVIN